MQGDSFGEFNFDFDGSGANGPPLSTEIAEEAKGAQQRQPSSIDLDDFGFGEGDKSAEHGNKDMETLSFVSEDMGSNGSTLSTMDSLRVQLDSSSMEDNLSQVSSVDFSFDVQKSPPESRAEEGEPDKEEAIAEISEGGTDVPPQSHQERETGEIDDMGADTSAQDQRGEKTGDIGDLGTDFGANFEAEGKEGASLSQTEIVQEETSSQPAPMETSTQETHAETTERTPELHADSSTATAAVDFTFDDFQSSKTEEENSVQESPSPQAADDFTDNFEDTHRTTKAEEDQLDLEDERDKLQSSESEQKIDLFAGMRGSVDFTKDNPTPESSPATPKRDKHLSSSADSFEADFTPNFAPVEPISFNPTFDFAPTETDFTANFDVEPEQSTPEAEKSSTAPVVPSKLEETFSFEAANLDEEEGPKSPPPTPAEGIESAQPQPTSSFATFEWSEPSEVTQQFEADFENFLAVEAPKPIEQPKGDITFGFDDSDLETSPGLSRKEDESRPDEESEVVKSKEEDSPIHEPAFGTGDVTEFGEFGAPGSTDFGEFQDATDDWASFDDFQQPAEDFQFPDDFAVAPGPTTQVCVLQLNA